MVIRSVITDGSVPVKSAMVQAQRVRFALGVLSKRSWGCVPSVGQGSLRMAARQNRWAVRARAKLVEQLGGRCCSCGTTERLELDHIRPIRWEPARLSSSARIAWYRAALEAGNLQVLCRNCNALKSATGDRTILGY